MLYVNVYLVGQVYGGPEEGNWYFPVGTPLASIPVKTERKPGYSYCIQNGSVHIDKCFSCKGTGEQEYDDDGLGKMFTSCEDCRYVPADLAETDMIMRNARKMFDDEAGRYEEIRVALEDHFAQPFPDRKPTYE